MTLRHLPGRVLPAWLWFPIKRQLRKVFPAPVATGKPGAPGTKQPRRVDLQALQKVDKRDGRVEGNAFFWQAAPEIPWTEVQERLLALHALDRADLIEDFVAKALDLSAGRHEMTLSLLARSAIAQASLSRVFARQDLDPAGPLADRMRSSQRFTSNYASAAFFVLDPASAQPLAQLIQTVYPRLPPAYFDLLDSQALSPAAPQDLIAGTIPNCPTRKPAGHRLVIADTLEDPTTLSLLFAGARRVTIFAPTNLYGKVSIPDELPLHCRPEELTVAHPRSRITRFSAKYAALHDETWRVAEQIIADLEVATDDFLGDGRRHAALHLADTLFFMAIRIAATEDMIADADFDQIVIASTGAGSPVEFLSGLTASVDLAADPRIEFVSLAPTAIARLAHTNALLQILDPEETSAATGPALPQLARPLLSLLQGMQRASAQRASGFLTFRPAGDTATTDDQSPGSGPETIRSGPEAIAAEDGPLSAASGAVPPVADPESQIGPQIGPQTGRVFAARQPDQHAAVARKRVLFVTTSAGAYNASSAEYLNILSQEYETLTGFVGTAGSGFLKNMPVSGPRPDEVRIQPLKHEAFADYPALAYAFRAALAQSRKRLDAEGTARITAQVLRKHGATVVERSLHPVFAHWIHVREWLAHLKAQDSLPDAMVVAPLRPALVGMTAAAARSFRVPTMALETHGLIATYCRYSRIMTDRYGVISSFFKRETATGFSIPADRVDVIGSPRLRAPEGYIPSKAKRHARLVVADNSQMTFHRTKSYAAFFSQPSSWNQISAVWSIILEAVRDLPDLHLLLKLHPEEGPTRANQFLDLAQRANLADRVHLLSCSAVEAIEAADLALACYSATVLEATMLAKPVFCVIDGDNEYPLNQHDVVGAPLFRDVDGLRAALLDFNRDSAPFVARAQQFLRNEPQIVTGPRQPLLDAVAALLATPPEQAIRPEEDLPQRLFLEGPFRIYDI